VEWFDSDEFELEHALDKFKEAEKLAAEVEKDLMDLKNEVNVIKKKFDESA
jgi:exonuclease VII small subunit